MTVKIITDSAVDLPKELIDQYNIDVIPIIVLLGDEEYLDGETIMPHEMLQNMREEKVYKTAQISAGTFKKVFTQYAKAGENCLYIAFSSELSGTYQTSVMVHNQLQEDYPEMNIDIIDSKCASIGFGLVVLKAAQMAQAGKSKDEIIQAVEFYAKHMEHIFTVDKLEYLYRGGRVSKTAAFVGTLLNIKPILDVEDGKLIPIEKVRGRRKIFSRMIEIMEERGEDLKNQLIGINHGDDLESAEKLKKMIQEKFGAENFVINTIGCAVGAHSGPGTLSVFFLNTKPPM